MKAALLFLVVSTAYIASALPLDDNSIGDEKPYQRFIEFPDEDGNMHLVDLESEPDWDLLTEIERNPANNQYFLYTRQNNNRAQTLILNDANSVRDSNYNGNRATVVISHGWLNKQSSNVNQLIRDAVLGRSDVNVIVVEWRRLAMSDYYTAVRGVPAIGRGVGQFINFLIRSAGGNLNNFHLIGFSLGSHVVGNAGRELGGRVARITGLDPAGPLWSNNNNRLNPNDAIYVEAIHTDGSLAGYGFGAPLANADFFPNGGNSQPGCVTNICDHNRSWELYAATVTHNHLLGLRCDDMRQMSSNNCRGPTLHMGNDNIRKTGHGIYRLSTGRRYPF